MSRAVLHPGSVRVSPRLTATARNKGARFNHAVFFVPSVTKRESFVSMQEGSTPADSVRRRVWKVRWHAQPSAVQGWLRRRYGGMVTSMSDTGSLRETAARDVQTSGPLFVACRCNDTWRHGCTVHLRSSSCQLQAFSRRPALLPLLHRNRGKRIGRRHVIQFLQPVIHDVVVRRLVGHHQEPQESIGHSTHRAGACLPSRHRFPSNAHSLGEFHTGQANVLAKEPDFDRREHSMLFHKCLGEQSVKLANTGDAYRLSPAGVASSYLDAVQLDMRQAPNGVSTHRTALCGQRTTAFVAFHYLNLHAVTTRKHVSERKVKTTHIRAVAARYRHSPFWNPPDWMTPPRKRFRQSSAVSWSCCISSCEWFENSTTPSSMISRASFLACGSFRGSMTGSVMCDDTSRRDIMSIPATGRVGVPGGHYLDGVGFWGGFPRFRAWPTASFQSASILRGSGFGPEATSSETVA